MSLYKFTHTPLLKNDDQLKQKSDKQPKKKKKSPNLLKTENHVPKKKKKKKKKKSNWTNCPCASAHGHFCPLSSLIFSLQFSLHF